MPIEKESLRLRILVIDDEINIRKMLGTSLELDGHEVVAVSNAQDAVDQASQGSFDIAFLDLQLGRTSGVDLMPRLTGQNPWMRIVIITAHGSIDTAVETMRRGATDYLMKPFTPGQIRLVTDRIALIKSLEQKVAGLEGVLQKSEALSELSSDNKAMQRVIETSRQIAGSDLTILLRGESGTGKGLVARAIHRWSGRSAKPFATVSAPTLSPQLLESELFGHAKGAFTGALRDNPGRVAACDGGTLFLDEIGDLPRDLQPKLLRFIQDREYERVGDSVTRRADVRIITATNINLEQAVRDGKFREDLLYRINVVQIDLPSLRERPEDVPRLAEHFLAQFRRDRAIVGFTDEAMAVLKGYPWPGNIRELRNVIERAAILCQADRIGVDHLPISITPQEKAIQVGDPVPLERLVELHVRRVLAQSKSLESAADVLGIDAATLWRRRKKYGI